MNSDEKSFHTISEDYEVQLKLKDIEIDRLKEELNVLLNAEIERLNEVVKWKEQMINQSVDQHSYFAERVRELEIENELLWEKIDELEWDLVQSAAIG